MAEQSLKEKAAEGLCWGGVSNGVQQVLALLCIIGNAPVIRNMYNFAT